MSKIKNTNGHWQDWGSAPTNSTSNLVDMYDLLSRPSTDRLCQFCNSRKIDDEVHFLINCEFHGGNRNSLLADISHLCCLDWNSSPQNKFECIMKSKNKSVLAAVAKFVYNGFKKNGAMGSTWLLCSTHCGHQHFNRLLANNYFICITCRLFIDLMTTMVVYLTLF